MKLMVHRYQDARCTRHSSQCLSHVFHHGLTDAPNCSRTDTEFCVCLTTLMFRCREKVLYTMPRAHHNEPSDLVASIVRGDRW